MARGASHLAATDAGPAAPGAEDLRVLGSEGWIYQRKLDGLRCVAVRNGAQVELWSRNHLSFTHRFPEIAAALAALPADNFTIDGELVAFDGERTSFARLQQPQSPARPELHAFDLLHLLGQDTSGLPLPDRRHLLAQLLEGVADQVRLVDAVEGDAASLLDAACRDGWEGLIAKRADSAYRAAGRPIGASSSARPRRSWLSGVGLTPPGRGRVWGRCSWGTTTTRGA